MPPKGEMAASSAGFANDHVSSTSAGNQRLTLTMWQIEGDGRPATTGNNSPRGSAEIDTDGSRLLLPSCGEHAGA